MSKIDKLQIKYFKAFKENLSIDFTTTNNSGNNLLIYGENGAGKSSIYEALKIVFFKNKLEESIPSASTPEVQEQNNRDFWSKFNNKSANSDFEILVNDDIAYSDFSTDSFQTFMISLNDTFFEDKIIYDVLLQRIHFDIESENFCSENYPYIQEEVNDALLLFQENIKIEIDNEDESGFTIKIIDTYRNIESKTEIRNYFNEAKLNLIVLLLLLTSIRYSANATKTKVLVLDDFITSLDIANRTFLMRYIFDNFADFQIILMTHNINFYNLAVYLIHEIYKKSDYWNFANIYGFDTGNRLVLKKAIKSVKEIRDLYSDSSQITQVGNEIRQKFEILLYEFSKILMIGAVEDTKKILEYIENSNDIYFNNGKTATDLVQELTNTLNDINENNLKNRLNTKINQYKQNEFNNIKDILKKLTLYRKVTMHPMSHGSIGQTSFTTKEIEISLNLLERFETYLKEFVNKDVSGI